MKTQIHSRKGEIIMKRSRIRDAKDGKRIKGKTSPNSELNFEERR